MLRVVICYVCLCGLLISCQMRTVLPGMEETLSKAGNNRKELFQVLRHYESQDDSLRLRAAQFLLENMADKGYLTGRSIEEYYSFIDSVYQIKQEEYDIPYIYATFRQQAKYLKENPVLNWDVQMLSADYLIQNIDEAFAVWNRPWNRHLTFDEFCEWILPYRVGTEIKAVGPNIVYHTALYADGKLQLTGNPFLLDSLGNINYFNPQTKFRISYVLERKNPEASNLGYLPPLMPGSRFQGSNKADFSDAVTFHTIKEIPEFKYFTVESENRTPVKYVRYQSSDKTWGNMAEVEFYAEGSDVPLNGKVIGAYIQSMYYPRNGAEKLFDGDPLSFFHSNDTLSWGGLELEQPLVIDRIRYIIRNDDNGIRKGHEYELFYMKDGAWLSLGKQTAKVEDRLVYDNLLQGALFWLRDYTRGVEERIFEIDKNQQVIWY